MAYNADFSSNIDNRGQVRHNADRHSCFSFRLVEVGRSWKVWRRTRSWKIVRVITDRMYLQNSRMVIMMNQEEQDPLNSNFKIFYLNIFWLRLHMTVDVSIINQIWWESVNHTLIFCEFLWNVFVMQCVFRTFIDTYMYMYMFYFWITRKEIVCGVRY